MPLLQLARSKVIFSKLTPSNVDFSLAHRLEQWPLGQLSCLFYASEIGEGCKSYTLYTRKVEFKE